MRTIRELVKGSAVASAMLEFRSGNGMTILDYQIIQAMPRVVLRCSVLNNKRDLMQDILGRVLVGDKRIETFSELWQMFQATRLEFFHYFSKLQLQVTIEDIILIQGMFAKRLPDQNILITANAKRTDEARRLSLPKVERNLLRELFAAIYVPPEPEFLNHFVYAINKKQPQDTSISLVSFLQLVRYEPILAKKFLDYFGPRLRGNYIEQIDNRFWEQLMDSENQRKITLTAQGDKNCLEVMQSVGISDDIVTCYDQPAKTFWELADCIKNVCTGGNPLLQTLTNAAEQI